MDRVEAYGAAWRAWRSYRGTGARTRAFLAARLAVLPLRALAEEFGRLEGHVLGVGSGHGLIARFLAEVNPRVTVDGYDVDAARVAVATATEERSPRVRIHVRDVRELHVDAEFDAAAAVDLMHHIPEADRDALIQTLVAAVRPGGTIVIKDIARTPSWKHGINRLHDRIVTGEPTTGIEPAALEESFARAGARTEETRSAAHLNPYPHFILRARRAPSPR